MEEMFCKGTTLPEAYHNALFGLHNHGEAVPCPDWNTEQIELSMTMVVENPLQEPMISKLFIGGPHELEQYRQEMLDGILDFEVIKGNWEYTYHERMEYQIKFVVNELKRNPSTRRAVISIRKAIDMTLDNPPCLQHIQYFVRDNKLHCKVLFRSNDACKATFMNAFALIMLQKRIADELGYEVGTYTHRANSFHCYAKDYELFNGYYRRLSTQSLEDITYNYVGNWQDLMEEEKPSIAAMVEELKNRE